MATQERIRAIVQLVEVFGESPGRLNEVFDILTINGVTLETVSALESDVATRLLLCSAEQAGRFRESVSPAFRIAAQIDHPRLSVITRGDASWPSRVDDHAAREMMPWLMVLGDVSMLSAPAIGIGGSRNATARSLDITRSLVRELVTHDRVIVSGGARGVDAIAHRTALEQGGRTVVVLAQGLGTFSVPPHWWPLIEQGELAVVSEFTPMAGWEGLRALQRNATIARLSDAFVVTQAEAMSGTLSAGRSAMRLQRALYMLSCPPSPSEGTSS